MCLRIIWKMVKHNWHGYCNQGTSFYSSYFSLDMLAIYDANISPDISMATAITRMNMHHLLITFIIDKTFRITFVFVSL